MEGEVFNGDIGLADAYNEGLLLNTFDLNCKDTLIPMLDPTPPTPHPQLTPLEVPTTRLKQIPEKLQLSSFGEDSVGFLCGHALDAYNEDFDVSDKGMGNVVWVYKVFSKKGKGKVHTRKGNFACKIGVKVHRVGAYGTENGSAIISHDSYGDLGIDY